jgi:hypothetical protein
MEKLERVSSLIPAIMEQAERKRSFVLIADTFFLSRIMAALCLFSKS